MFFSLIEDHWFREIFDLPGLKSKFLPANMKYDISVTLRFMSAKIAGIAIFRIFENSTK